MQAVETALNVPRVSESFIRFWLARRGGAPSVEKLVRVADKGAPVEVGGIGHFKAALAYSNHCSMVSYSERSSRTIGTVLSLDLHSIFLTIQQRF